jgi:hypothetical protein
MASFNNFMLKNRGIQSLEHSLSEVYQKGKGSSKIGAFFWSSRAVWRRIPAFNP